MILNTSISGGGAKLNGVKGNYLATADVAKGDFVQLTTWGVEEPKFSKSHDLADGVNAFNRAAVVVMSATQILCVWSANESMPNNVYAQAVTYKDAAWVAGTALLLGSYSNASSYVNAVSADRLTDTQAAVAIGTASKIMVINIAENGDVTVAAEKSMGLNAMSVSGKSNTLAVVAVTPERFAVFFSQTFSSGEYLKCNVCNYVNGDITVITAAGSISSDSSYSLSPRYCKLNDSTVLAATLSGSKATGSLIAVQIADSGWSKLVDISSVAQVKDCDMAYWANNQVIMGVNQSSGGDYLSMVHFDADSMSITIENLIGEEIDMNRVYGAERISDNKACVWYTNSNGHNLDVLNVATKELTHESFTDVVLNTTTPTLGKLSSAAFGWLALLEGATKLWIAPCISKTTAAPYVTRLDGVASKGAIAGQMAEVVTPK